MRFVRLVSPALVAVLAWLASDALAWVRLTTDSRQLRVMLGFIAPDTMSRAAEAPWPLGAAAIGTIVVALAATYTAVGVLARPVRGVAGFAAAWFAAVVAGATVVSLPIVALGIAAVIDPLGLGQFAVDPIQAAAYWGLVWGWAPALTAFLLDRGDVPSRRPRRTVAVVCAGIAVVALAAVVVVEPVARAAWHTDLQEQVEEPNDVPEPTVGPPVPEVAPGDWQVDPLWCTDNQLEFAASRPDAAAGARAMTVTATNVSQATCVLEGYPDLAFSEPDTTALEVRIEHGNAMVDRPDEGPVRLEVAPGSNVTAVLGWRAMPTAEDEPAGWLHVAPYHGALRQALPVETDITGGEVVVTAWRVAD
ncbi:DUF4232 domain-containing protein [Agromyces cerinus]|uniref:DUF4232 domain-containing protein n=1 Tax=Agromyces cerinus subsp. cerinus TaxID=232089 RepID=A0A1N6HTR3_9MICO|nr:DUF4232 domain-containing protein [Agromyces cerinus]SIO23110.1 Protein of unknown function [Agromyces cerinus subsp. cerinus]